MTAERLSPDILIRPNGQVELLDRPEPAAWTGSYGDAMRPCSRGVPATARTRRLRPRVPDTLVRGRLVDIQE